MYEPSSPSAGVDLFVSPISRNGFADTMRMVTSASSATYPATNRAYYFPIVLPVACTVYRFFWLNGATAAGANNLQVGIYNDNDAGTDGPGTSFLLGTSTAGSGINVCQFDNVTDTPIYPGRYWLAIWCSGTTNTLFRSAPSAVVARMVNGYLESSLASGLPATATPAQNTTPYIPIFGFTTISSP